MTPTTLSNFMEKTKKTGKKGMKAVKAATRASIFGILVYAGGGKMANNYIPDRALEQEVVEKDSLGEKKYFVGNLNLQDIIDENELNITPVLLYALYQNEVNNKTNDLIGKTVSDISEGVRKSVPILPTANNSFGTRQIQHGAFLEFIKEKSITEKMRLITKLGSLIIDGQKVMQRVGFKDDEISGFLGYIEKGNYNTEDGNDKLGKGDGTVGFAMSMVMIDEIYSKLKISRENIKAKYNEENIVSQYLLNDEYKYLEGAVSALRATNSVRAQENLPQQLKQNIHIISARINKNIGYDEITKSTTNKNTSNKQILSLDLPDGDIGPKFEKNQSTLEQWSLDDDTQEHIKIIQNFAKTADIEEKRKLVTLLANSSFESLYFGLDRISQSLPTAAQQNKHKFINNTLDKGQLYSFFSKLSETHLDDFIQVSIAAFKICSDPHVNFTIPVIQKAASHTNNTVNTVSRFNDGVYNTGRNIQMGDGYIPISNDTVLYTGDTLQSFIDTTQQGVVETIENIEKPIPTVVIPKPIAKKTSEEINNKMDQTKYSCIRTIKIRDGIIPRNLIKNQSQIMGYLIRNKHKDLDGKLITAETDAGRIPVATVASFLSLDKKTPLSPGELNRLPIGKDLYLILPK